MAREHPTLEPDPLWIALTAYIAAAFRKHGMQTTVLLDPNVQAESEHTESLSHMLGEALRHHVEPNQQARAKTAVSDFFSFVGDHLDRSKWVAQLADSTFNICSLRVSPEVAKRLRENLSPLQLFLDTNTLLSILDLHVHMHVEVSQQLLQVIADNHFPFTLHYHEETRKEMAQTLQYYGDKLRARAWGGSLSRAAARTRNLSGIELKYHEMNGVQAITPDAFLGPSKHFDELLKRRKIQIYRSSLNRDDQRTALYAEYEAFLIQRGQDKDHDRIRHDVILLDTVREIRSRSQAKSSLEAGALLITSDYYLYRFDRENSHSQGQHPCVALPSTFWQILRPYVPTSENFDRIFAETFAIPEFRSIGSNASRACSKMMQILAGYKNIPEELSVRMLSNDMLIEKLRQEPDDDKFRELVESELESEAARASHENVELKQQIALMQREAALTKAQDDEQRREHDAKNAQIVTTLQNLEGQVRDLHRDRQRRDEERMALEDEQRRQLEAARAAKVEAETKAEKTEQESARLTAQANILKTVSAICIGLAVIGAVELYTYSAPWTWLRDHSNSYGLQIEFALLVVSIAVGWARPTLRAAYVASLVIGLVLAATTIVGGPKRENSPDQRTKANRVPPLRRNSFRGVEERK